MALNCLPKCMELLTNLEGQPEYQISNNKYQILLMALFFRHVLTNSKRMQAETVSIICWLHCTIGEILKTLMMPGEFSLGRLHYPNGVTIRDCSLIMTWGGSVIKQRECPKKVTPYGNTLKINDPPLRQ